jgi:hypothetical protein
MVTESHVVDATSGQISEADPRVTELVAENALLRDDNTSLRGELTRAQSALANLRARYHQLVEELHLLKRRLIIAKAERVDDVAAAQLAFDELLAETQAIEKVLDAAGGAEEDNHADDDAPANLKFPPCFRARDRIRCGSGGSSGICRHVIIRKGFPWPSAC